MAKKYRSILPAIKRGAAKLQAQQDKTAQDLVIKKLFNSNDNRFLTKMGRKRRAELMTEIGHTLSNTYSALIKEKFDELGVPYIPFMINYIQTEKLANLTDKAGKNKGVKIPKHNFTIGLDYDFVRSVNNRKISYHTWMIRKNPELGRRYYREVIRGLSRKDKYTSTPQWEIGGRLWKQYQKEVPQEEKTIMFTDHDAGGVTKKGYIKGEFVVANMATAHHVNDTTYTKQPIPPSHHMKKNQIYLKGDTMKVNMESIDKFLENERYLFGGNLNKFLTAKYGTAEYKDINNILVSVLGEFKKDLEVIAKHFVEKDWENLAEHEDKNKRTGLTRPYKNDAKTRSQWKYKPKFPNIESILWWFLNDKDGMASSTKLPEYSNLKTLKQKANWIDRSVFLIANGVYARKLGHSRGLTPSGKQKKYGLAATIKKARRYKKYGEHYKKSERTRNLTDWRKTTSTAARSLAQSNRKNNPTSRKDNRKDNRKQ